MAFDSVEWVNEYTACVKRRAALAVAASSSANTKAQYSDKCPKSQKFEGEVLETSEVIRII